MAADMEFRALADLMNTVLGQDTPQSKSKGKRTNKRQDV
jgi:hypothetical protein